MKAMGITAMTENLLKTQAFKLKGRLYTLTVLHLIETDVVLFDTHLSELITIAPRLFDKAPIVLDCSTIIGKPIDLSALCNCMRKKGIIPIGIQGGDALLNTLAQAQGLALFNASASHDKALTVEESTTPVPEIESTTPHEINKTKCLLAPVRSGQQVVSKGGDLMIIASVGHGAELLADGNIHVYGTLRGRALAGIAGDKYARIFCQSLEAELVSIAGHYCLSDAMPVMTGPCQIFLQDNRIQIEAL